MRRIKSGNIQPHYQGCIWLLWHKAPRYKKIVCAQNESSTNVQYLLSAYYQQHVHNMFYDSIYQLIEQS